LALLDLERADEPDVDETADRQRRVGQDEHVHRVAIAGGRSRDEAEIERERHPGRQHVAQPEPTPLLVISQLVLAPPGRLDDDFDAVGSFTSASLVRLRGPAGQRFGCWRWSPRSPWPFRTSRVACWRRSAERDRPTSTWSAVKRPRASRRA